MTIKFERCTCANGKEGNSMKAYYPMSNGDDIVFEAEIAYDPDELFISEAGDDVDFKPDFEQFDRNDFDRESFFELYKDIAKQAKKAGFDDELIDHDIEIAYYYKKPWFDAIFNFCEGK